MMKKNILIIVIAAVVFELILRGSLHSGGQASAIHDEHVGYWHKSNFSSNHTRDCYDVEYSFGEFGEVAPFAPYNDTKAKITILGNSYVEAAMVDNKNIVHNALYNELDEKYDVLNFGLYGTTLFHQALIYEHKVPQYNEAYLIHFVNFLQALDYKPTLASPMSRQLSEGGFEQGEIIIKISRENSTLESIRDLIGYTEYYEHILTTVAHIRGWFKGAETSIANPVKSSETIIQKQKRSEEQWEQLKAGIRYMNGAAVENSSKFVAVVHSSHSFLTTNLYVDFIQWLQKENIPYIDLDLEMRRLELNEYGFSCDFHWNDNTHKNIAKILAKKINKLESE